VFQPQTGSASARVFDDAGTGRDHRLAPVALGHRATVATCSKPGAQALRDSGVLAQLPVERGRHHLTRHVIVGRAQSAREDDEVGPREGRPEQVRELLSIVAGDGLHHDVDAERVQMPGDEERVGVDTKGRQELAADRNDPGAGQRFHASQPAGVIQISPRITRLP